MTARLKCPVAGLSWSRGTATVPHRRRGRISGVTFGSEHGASTNVGSDKSTWAKLRPCGQELMPIVVVARQPRGIQAQHQPRLPEANLGDQPLEAAAAVARRTGLPEVVVNDLNPFLGPAEQGCTIDQPILQLGALLMLTDLAGGRLAHVNIGQLGAMRRRHWAFQIEQHVHRDAPRSNRRRRLRPALTGVAAPPASPAVVVLSASSSAIISAPRSAVDPAMPARTAGSAVWADVSSNLSPKAESVARTD